MISVTNLLEEHVLCIRLSLSDAVSLFFHLAIVLLIAVDLILDGSVLVQELLSLLQALGDVLRGHGSHGLGQPGLEFV